MILRDAVDDPSSDEEGFPATAPEVHHQMSFWMRDKLERLIWLNRNKEDPACKVSPKATTIEHVWHSKYNQNFLLKLKNHLLTWLQGLEYDGYECEYSVAERNQVIIKDSIIYQHKTLYQLY